MRQLWPLLLLAEQVLAAGWQGAAARGRPPDGGEERSQAWGWPRPWRWRRACPRRRRRRRLGRPTATILIPARRSLRRLHVCVLPGRNVWHVVVMPVAAPAIIGVGVRRCRKHGGWPVRGGSKPAASSQISESAATHLPAAFSMLTCMHPISTPPAGVFQACSTSMQACESATPAAGGGAARAAGGASSQRLKTASSCALVGTAAASAVHASVGLRELQVSHSLPACLHAPHACTACMHVSTASLHTPFALRLAFLRRVRSCLRCSAAWLEASLCLFRVPGLAPALLPRGIDQAVMS